MGSENSKTKEDVKIQDQYKIRRIYEGVAPKKLDGRSQEKLSGVKDDNALTDMTNFKVLSTDAYLTNLFLENETVIFLKTYCLCCRLAKSEFTNMNHRVEIVELDTKQNREEILAHLKLRTGYVDLPMIFVNGCYRGGASLEEKFHEKYRKRRNFSEASEKRLCDPPKSQTKVEGKKTCTYQHSAQPSSFPENDFSGRSLVRIPLNVDSAESKEEELLRNRIKNLSLGDKVKKGSRMKLCRVCFGTDHESWNCPLAQKKGRRLTVYQGDERCMGEFRCSGCKKQWVSCNSWANKGQECSKCNITVYPHKQEPLQQPGKLKVVDVNKKHPQQRCEKCRELGSYCRKGKKLQT